MDVDSRFAGRNGGGDSHARFEIVSEEGLQRCHGNPPCRQSFESMARIECHALETSDD